MPGFNSSFDVEQARAENAFKKKKETNEDCLQCPKCKSTWFEQIKAQQFLDEHSVILGQAVPPKGQMEFVLLRCVKCAEVVEPRLLRQGRDTANTLYEQFLDSMKSDIKSEKL